MRKLVRVSGLWLLCAAMVVQACERERTPSFGRRRSGGFKELARGMQDSAIAGVIEKTPALYTPLYEGPGTITQRPEHEVDWHGKPVRLHEGGILVDGRPVVAQDLYVVDIGHARKVCALTAKVFAEAAQALAK